MEYIKAIIDARIEKNLLQQIAHDLGKTLHIEFR